MKSQSEQLQLEYDAFKAALGGMLVDHAGKFVIFKDGQPAGFFPSFEDAYGAALGRYGVDEVFLVDHVSDQQMAAASISWELAVL